MKRGEALLERELNLILDPETKLDEEELAVRRELYDHYPRKPSAAERRRYEEIGKKDKLKTRFQKMYGLEEEDEDD